MKRLVVAAALFAMPAFAQQQPQSSPAEQALSDRLLSEIQSNVQARAQLIEAQRQITAKDARIKELEAAVAKPADPK